jgi:hypothetical protein
MGPAQVMPTSVFVGGSDLGERGIRVGVIYLTRLGSGVDQSGSVLPPTARRIGITLLYAVGFAALGAMHLDHLHHAELFVIHRMAAVMTWASGPTGEA